MLENTSLLYSNYIIDGIAQPVTPAQMLRECATEGALPAPAPECPADIADESVDLSAEDFPFSLEAVPAYSEAIAALPRRPFPVPFAAPYSCGKVAQALIDAIWQGGHFRLGDLSLKAEWRWDQKAIGNMAAFYASVEAACRFTDEIGLKFREVQVAHGQCALSIKAATALVEEDLPEEEEDEETSVIRELPFRTSRPRMSRRRRCPSSLLPHPSDWLVYIPFDSCSYRLGGSTLAAAVGARPAVAPDIGDADYFIDGYEVVRELVEDGIVKAGATVFQGGLMSALQRMTSECGAEIGIGSLCKAVGDATPVQVLFSEVPGVVVQIDDTDYDYLDAELLLQDVAYYPLGHPDPERPGVRVSGEASDISRILESLMNTLEGED